MKTKSRNKKRTPKALSIALAQVAEALKKSGADKLAELLGAKEGAGYAQVVWAVERLSNAALEWEELRQQRQQPVRNQPGVSSETQDQLELKLQQMN